MSVPIAKIDTAKIDVSIYEVLLNDEPIGCILHIDGTDGHWYGSFMDYQDGNSVKFEKHAVQRAVSLWVGKNY